MADIDFCTVKLFTIACVNISYLTGLTLARAATLTHREIAEALLILGGEYRYINQLFLRP